MKFEKQMVFFDPMDGGVFAELKGEGVGQEQIQLILQYESLNKDISSIISRLLKFQKDGQLLKQIKVLVSQIQSEVMQISLDGNEDKRINRRDNGEGEEIIQKQLKRKFTSSDRIIAKSNTFHQTGRVQMEGKQELIEKLRRLKKRNPEEFNSVLSNSSQIKVGQSFLNAVNYVGINREVIALQKVPSKANYWKIHQDQI